MNWFETLLGWINPRAPRIKKLRKPKPPEPEPTPVVLPVVTPKKKPTGRRTTTTGRVVYNRKRHFFTIKDVKRILRNILEEDEAMPVNIDAFIRDLVDVLNALREILANFTTLGAYDFMKDALDELLELISKK